MTTAIHAANGILSASMTTLYTVPDNRKFVVKAFSLVNDTAVVVTLRVQVTFSSTGVARVLLPDRNVADNDSDFAPEVLNQVLDAGGIIEAQGANLTYALSGILLTG